MKLSELQKTKKGRLVWCIALELLQRRPGLGFGLMEASVIKHLHSPYDGSKGSKEFQMAKRIEIKIRKKTGRLLPWQI